ncbi:MAG: hypothetical protein ACI3W7_08920 [Oscillospiraceae bacterium]
MKSIISVIMTAVLLLSVLTACGTNRTGNVEEARVTPGTAAQATNSPSATNRPSATNTPGTTDRDNTVGGAVGDAVEDVGDAAGSVVGGAANAVGDVVGGVGNAVDDAAKGVGNAVNDMTDDTRTGAEGRVNDNDGVIGNER